ncbi:MAG: DEAD/DEAH box helicase family protein [Alphaproteobacteria bacterium]|nr:DEAD/DEAH box helicase family protein [Alphaproteobacteria bacterium]MDA8003624.1 DEAD/DEAH box helicase family protein [Alphaproteobacteria bacterium]MDA8005039.1 DEAD/DEAH box helicase family protein [Alphaproteobacteria bacterium]MDA8012422.1 DEAD/DEAH box helicase family protein [Alphaproteobacteria bacterium]
MALNDLTLARTLSRMVNGEASGLEDGAAPMLDKVSPMTAELLRFWFAGEWTGGRDINFHKGQKQAILNAVYAHEVLQTRNLKHLYEEVAPRELLGGLLPKDGTDLHPLYCVKMATGTGKTWVLHALLIWSYLNASYSEAPDRFTKNFLIITPGLIVYQRILDAFLGKEKDGKPDLEKSDFHKYQDLLIPERYRGEVLAFIGNAFCRKEDIGRKTTGDGVIAVTNWHAIQDKIDEADDGEEDAFITPGETPDPKDVIKGILPTPLGAGAGSDLGQLNKKRLKGEILEYLHGLPSLMVFNDEAHHIHEDARQKDSVVEWKKSLNYIAEPKQGRFTRFDFSATPYSQKTASATPSHFPHIISDFDLKEALRNLLVKSLLLDKRIESGAIPQEELDMDYRAERYEEGRRKKGKARSLSEGQRLMLRMGITKLGILETEFRKLDETKRPKMLVVCEDTTVTPLVSEFLLGEGLTEEDILTVDSSRKGELKQGEWAKLRERLFDLDDHEQPRVVINVLMLREGFDVNNICVIVPLRTAGSRILLEQTIGRGLRLMWREADYTDAKKENRRLIDDGHAPDSLIDMLSIIEHPNFQDYYDELMADNLIVATDDDPRNKVIGDMLSVELRDGYEAYDFEIPVRWIETDEEIKPKTFDVNSLKPFNTMDFSQLKSALQRHDRAASVDVQKKTRFGDYSVKGGVMTSRGYNDYLARMTTRISENVASRSLVRDSRSFARFPYLQVQRPLIAEWIDRYIRTRLFAREMDPMEDENWRLLLLDYVAEHIIKEATIALAESEETEIVGETQVFHKRLSEVPALRMRESLSLPVSKCIYERLRFASQRGGFERDFITAADRDASVRAFCKIDEYKHDFLKFRYIRVERDFSRYSPDFIVRCDDTIYLVETKGTDQLSHPNVTRKMTAASDWCRRVNELPPEHRSHCEWQYVLLGQEFFNQMIKGHKNIKDILDHAKVRPSSESGGLDI